MPPVLALAGLGFLLGRVDLFGLLWPLGPAAQVAVTARWPRLNGPLAASLILGALSREAWAAGAALAAFCALHAACARRFPGAGLRWVLLSLTGASLIPYGVLLLGRFPGPYGLLLLAFQSVLGALLAAAFFVALAPSPSPPVRTLLEVSGDRAPVLSLLAGCAIAGLKGFTLGPVEAAPVAAGLLLAAAGWAWGAGGGAVAGTVAGAVQALTGAAPVAAMGAYALSGTLAGIFREWGRHAAVAGAAAGAAAAWFASVTGQAAAAGTVLGNALLLALPPATARSLHQAGAASLRMKGGDRSRRDGRWRDLSRLLREVARSCREVAVAESRPAPEQEMAALVARLMREVCDGCPRHRVCWQEGFPAHYQMVADLLARDEGGSPLTAEAVQEAWRGRCVHPKEVALFLRHLVEVRSLERRWRRRLGESRELMAGHFQGLAGIIDDLSRGEGRFRRAAAREADAPPRLSYVTEVAKLARPGWMISGDSHLVRELPGAMLLLALSDGMGSGLPAASESRAAVDLVEKLMQAGFDRRTVVRMTNSLMGLRAPDESFATLDLALVDLVSGEAEFIKVGAAPSFLVRQRSVRVIRGSSLPLGILAAADMETARLSVEPGDVLIMVTDGVLEGAAGPSAREDWIRKVILSRMGNKGKGLARALLEEVSVNLPGGRADDMTVLAVRFWQGAGG